MDRGSARVIAAAGGEVIGVADGHYDRCHSDPATLDITCDGHEMRGNFVRLRHAGGWETLYYHLKSGSVLVAVGDRVRCGDRLGRIGSSGYSSGPHLHFEVQDADGVVWDPYAGPHSQELSLWTEQGADDALPANQCAAAWSEP